jgi:hypothetical protein
MCTFFIAIVEKHIALSSPYSPSTHKIRIKKKINKIKLGKGNFFLKKKQGG